MSASTSVILYLSASISPELNVRRHLIFLRITSAVPRSQLAALRYVVYFRLHG